MEPCEIKMELNLKTIIAETKEVTQALNEFTDTLEQIEKKYVEPIKCTCTDEESWEEDKIVENNCTTVTVEDADEWYGLVLKCDNCDGDFMLGGFVKEQIGEKFCPHCGKKFVKHKEESE